MDFEAVSFDSKVPEVENSSLKPTTHYQVDTIEALIGELDA